MSLFLFWFHCRVVKIRRVQVMADMISLFKDETVMDYD